MMIELCKPFCKKWEEKLRRCEVALKSMKNADPEKSCMYPMRDWVTCVEGCVQPKIHSFLKGQERGFISWEYLISQSKYVLYFSLGYIIVNF